MYEHRDLYDLTKIKSLNDPKETKVLRRVRTR